MKSHKYIAASVLVLFCSGTHAMAEPQDFESLCRDVSTKDGLPQDQIDQFCPCLAEKVSDTPEVEAELRASTTKEGNPETRLADLSEAASKAVIACQGG